MVFLLLLLYFFLLYHIKSQNSTYASVFSYVILKSMKTKKYNSTNEKQLNIAFGTAIAFSLLLRIFLAATTHGFDSDIACFSAWATRIYEGGFSNFYMPDVFTDYPPGYIYILYPIGALLHHLQINSFSALGLILLKMPSILCDIAAGIVIFLIGRKHTNEGTAIVISLLYLLNPAVLLNSVVWGQTDSCLTLCVLLLCLFLTEGKVIPAGFSFAAGLLLKPQMLIFSPILLYGIYDYGIRDLFTRKKKTIAFTSMRPLLQIFAGGMSAIVCLLLAMLPFGLHKVLPQYTDTLKSYPYASVNAYNLWGFLGKNWTSQETLIGNTGITYASLGTLAIVLLTFLSALLFEQLRRKGREERYFLTASFIIITMFLFSVRMHERYLYPAMILVLITGLYCRQLNFIPTYLVITLGHTINVWYVLFHYDPGTYFSTQHETVKWLSGFMLLCAAYYYYCLIRLLVTKTDTHDIKPNRINDTFVTSKKPLSSTINLNKTASDTRFYIQNPPNPMLFFLDPAHLFKPRMPVASNPSKPLNKKDLLLICIITCIYAIVAFTNLGYRKAPETEHLWKANNTVLLQFETTETPVELCYYLRTEKDIAALLQQSTDGQTWENGQNLSMKNVFTWHQVPLTAGQTYVKLTNNSEDATIGEFIFRNAEGEIVTPLNTADYPELFDEANTLPETFDYRSNSYFDEIYYFRTANEFMNELPAYENTHPPLGKSLIALGALLFGTNPFGFRFMGTLFGVLMLPFLYIFAKNITDNRFVASITTLCFAFDFMHYTQTRLATIDVYIVFFIILMFCFMERYLRLSFYDTKLTKTFLPLGLSGIAFGLGIACKWSGFYAGAGLAILFFTSLYQRFQEYRYACAHPQESSNGIAHNHIRKTFIPNACKTIGFCILFFVIIPLTIYILSYLPFRDYSQDGFWTRMWNNQFTMFNYHSKLEATHPYSSLWYEWPTMVRPVFYFSKTVGDGLYQGISAFGNPLVWYTAIPMAMYTAYMALFKQNKTARFLCISFLAQFLPWTLISRCTFLYHYFPSVPFLVLMIGFTMAQMHKKIRPQIFYPLCVGYCAAVIAMFVMFYPVITGTPVSGEYVNTYLKRMDSWVLIIQK